MFNYKSQTEKYINKELDIRLGEFTTQGIVKSEEEYKKIIDGLLKSIEGDAGRITSSTRYLVRPDETVASGKINNLFKDLESDMRILHNELRDAKKVMDLSLARNKIFFRHIKDKVASIWKEIGKFRETSFNTESADYTFFESFDADDSNMTLSGLTVDRKKGILHLTPAEVDTHFESRDIQEVTLSLYPPENRDGGVYETTNPNNKITADYDSGNRDMMKSGLWKVQLLTADVPSTLLDVLTKSTTTTYRGVVAYLDIVFTGQKTINEFGFDPYGEFPVKILGIRYKKTLASDWQTATTTDNEEVESHVIAEDSDWMYIRNINTITARCIRIILHQENYITVSKLMSSVDSMVDKMIRDLQEKRYQKSDYRYKFTDAIPRVSDTDEEHGTLYDEIMKIIEEDGSIDSLETKISEVLIPQPAEINTDIRNWKVYNIGAWSIEPKFVTYAPAAAGIYMSHDPLDRKSGFRFNNGAPTEATLYTRQTEPTGTAIEWYLTADNGVDAQVDIPIIPNSDLYRTEVISIGKYYPLSNVATDSTYRTTTNLNNVDNVIKLDFPIHPAYVGEVILYENGKELVNENAATIDVRGKVIEMYNSTELYIPDIDIESGRFIYAIKYIPAAIDTVKCWVLVPTRKRQSGYIDIGSAMIFANPQLAKFFASYLPKIKLGDLDAPPHVSRSDNYQVRMHLCTKDEYDDWFVGGRVPIFIDACVDTDAKPGIEWLFKNTAKINHNSTPTRLTWLYNNVNPIKPYSDDASDKDTWSSLPSAPPMLNLYKKQYTRNN